MLLCFKVFAGVRSDSRFQYSGMAPCGPLYSLRTETVCQTLAYRGS